MPGWLVVLVFLGLGVAGVAMVADSGGPDDYLGVALVFVAAYLPWWAAVARAGDSWSPARRSAACGLSALLAGIASGSAVVSVVDAIATLAGDTFGFVAFAFLGFPLAIVLWARHFWAVLARDAPLANERHLLLAITLSAVLAFAVDLLAGSASASSGEMLAGLLAAFMAFVAGGIAIAMVVPWIVWAVRWRRAASPWTGVGPRRLS